MIDWDWDLTKQTGHSISFFISRPFGRETRKLLLLLLQYEHYNMRHWKLMKLIQQIDRVGILRDVSYSSESISMACSSLCSPCSCFVFLELTPPRLTSWIWIGRRNLWRKVNRKKVNWKKRKTEQGWQSNNNNGDIRLIRPRGWMWRMRGSTHFSRFYFVLFCFIWLTVSPPYFKFHFYELNPLFTFNCFVVVVQSSCLSDFVFGVELTVSTVTVADWYWQYIGALDKEHQVPIREEGKNGSRTSERKGAVPQEPKKHPRKIFTE